MGLFNIILLDSVDSTNTYLKRNYEIYLNKQILLKYAF